MNREPPEVLRRIGELNQARLVGGRRAPHQPLLLLYLLGRIQRGESSAVHYRQAEPTVSALIDGFGPPARSRHRADLPFMHLSPALWSLDAEVGGKRHAQLRREDAQGRLRAEMDAVLRNSPALLNETARRLLVNNFPKTYFAPICEAIGLDLDPSVAGTDPYGSVGMAESVVVSRRDARFREAVLLAYNYACAMCGFDGRLMRDPVGVQAAHVRWHALGGPDDTSNGVALCDLHHTLFDRGVLGLDAGRRVRVSPAFNSTSASAAELVRSLESRPLAVPNPGVSPPAQAHIAWHGAQVFRAA